MAGKKLHQRLIFLENRPGIKTKLKQAVIRSSQNVSEANCENDDENLRVKPRNFVFPEAEKEGLNIFCYVDVPLPKGLKACHVSMSSLLTPNCKQTAVIFHKYQQSVVTFQICQQTAVTFRFAQ